MAFKFPHTPKFNLKPWQIFAALSLSVLLSACGDPASQSGPGGLVPEDAKALDAAAKKLDEDMALPPPSAAPSPTQSGTPKAAN
jgi:hypothetical protein